MESTACTLCGTDDARPELTLRDLGSGRPERFNLVCCRRCGLRYLNPRPSPSEMGAYTRRTIALIDRPSKMNPGR